MRGSFYSAINVIDHNNGTLTAMVGTFLARDHSVQITVDGVLIGNTPTELIRVHPNIANYRGTDCDTKEGVRGLPSEVTAGVSYLFQCDPQDVYDNDVSDDFLYLEAEFRHLDRCASRPIGRPLG